MVMRVDSGSPAEQAGVRVGDLLLKLAGQPLEDELDLRFCLRGPAARLELQRDGELLVRPLRITDGIDPGWELEPLEMRTCHCDCVFCFVQQLPEGLRPSLYVKDEDYRFSFLFGNYLTLVGFTARDLERVLRLRLSPLYVSIHATDPVLRGRLLGLKRAAILPMLKKLIDGGIEIHGQIVLAPGWNDGDILAQTLEDLLPLCPGLASLSVVPVGLTQHRQNLESLRLMNCQDAANALRTVRVYQRRLRDLQGSRWVYPADELLLLTGEPIPAAEEYEDYPQLENGVGLCRWTLDQAAEALVRMPATLPAPRRLLWVTGRSAQPILRTIAASFYERIKGLSIAVLGAENTLLGSTVTVAGLLAGRDMLTVIGRYLNERSGIALDGIYLPPDCLNSDGLLLDDWTVADIEKELGLSVEAFDGNWERMIFGDRLGGQG